MGARCPTHATVAPGMGTVHLGEDLEGWFATPNADAGRQGGARYVNSVDKAAEIQKLADAEGIEPAPARFDDAVKGRRYAQWNDRDKQAQAFIKMNEEYKRACTTVGCLQQAKFKSGEAKYCRACHTPE